MEHAVFFPGPDGSPSFRRFASLDEAVRFVEHLRNIEGVAEVSLHALTPVPVSFRPYYRVEVSTTDAPTEPTATEPGSLADPMLEGEPTPATDPMPGHELTPVADPMSAGDETPVAEPVSADAALPMPEQSSNGKRSLGFFAR